MRLLSTDSRTAGEDGYLHIITVVNMTVVLNFTARMLLEDIVNFIK